ncbi:MAG: O-antigen ligase family protein, partial [Acidimicrobiia bacterium]|nr:O-antigen ligase family protein [Acidimicrobiia bacterium]
PISVNDLKMIRVWIATGAGATGFYALSLAATGNLPTTGAGVARFEITGAGGGEGGDPNITAAALVVPIAVALWEGLNPERSRRERVFFLLAAAGAGVAVLLTASRGGLISVAIVAIITVLSYRRGVVSLALLGLLVLPAVLLAPSTFETRAGNSGTTGRTEIWRLAIESCPEYCPTGSGFGTFADVHETAFLISEEATGTQLRYQAHSIWFGVLIELGVLGFVLLVAALTITVRDVFRLPESSRGGALAGMVGLLVASTFLSDLTFKFFWMALIYSVLVVSSTETQGPAAVPPTSRSLTL